MAGLATTLGSGAMTNSLDEIFKADVVLLVGTNTTWAHPVFGYLLKQAVKHRGTKLIVCDPRRIELAERAEHWLKLRHGSDVALLSGLQHIIFNEGLENSAYIAERCENFEPYRRSMEWFTPERVEKLTGVPKQQLQQAARLYAKGGRGALYYCLGVTQHCHGVDNVKACVNLQLITGNIGFEGGGVNPLRGQNNVQGACDMGALPNVYCGYQPVSDVEVRRKFAARWGVPEHSLSLQPGLTQTEMMPACGDKIRALYVVGENPLLADPNSSHIEASLKKLDLLVVQDIFLTETARLADVVLPAVTFAEKHGTFTNTERRVQLSHQALEPLSGAKADHEIIAELAARFEHSLPRTPEALFSEIRDLNPSYAGISYERIREVGLQWPCPSAEHPGTRYLHKDKFTRGKALFSPMTYIPPSEVPDEQWPLTLSTGRILEHYHTGSMTRRATVLDALEKCGYIEVHPKDAARLGVRDGETVRVVTRRGAIQTQARVVERVGEGTLFASFHFAEASANCLTNDALDPVAKIPEYKVCAARIEKIPEQKAEAGRAGA